MNAKTTYMMVAMPYMFARKWVVLKYKKYTFKHYKKNENTIDRIHKDILYTDKLIAASWSALVGIYLFPFYTLMDIRSVEEKIRNIEREENILNNFMDILIE